MFFVKILDSTHPERDAFTKTRHPGACRDPEKSLSYWIPACTGMMRDIVSGWALARTAV
jgi:hypothetical protein